MKKILKQANRLLDWRYIAVWIVVMIATEQILLWYFNHLVAYAPPSQLPAGAAPYQPATSEIVNIEFIKTPAVCFIMGVYGLYRAILFQPFQDPYRSWLLRSAWTSEKELPLGPMRLTILDVIIVALLAVPVWAHPKLCLIAAGTFLAAYMIAQWQTFFIADRLHLLWLAIAVLATSFLVSVPNLVWSIPLSICIVFGIVGYVQRQSLMNLRNFYELSDSSIDKKLGNSSAPLGYAIGPNLKKTWQPDFSFTSLAISIIWCLFCFGSLFGRLEDSVCELFMIPTFAIAATLSLMRGRPCYAHSPPRPRTSLGHLIQPNYDVIFVAPLTIVFIAILSVLTMSWFPLQFSCPISAACMLLVYRYMPPNAEQWKTTGAHRIVASSRNTRKHLLEQKAMN